MNRFWPLRDQHDRQSKQCTGYRQIQVVRLTWSNRSIHIFRFRNRSRLHAYHSSVFVPYMPIIGLSVQHPFKSSLTSCPERRSNTETPKANPSSNSKNVSSNTTNLAVSHASTSPAIGAYSTTAFLRNLPTDVASPTWGTKI
jgi:hypothetical protein